MIRRLLIRPGAIGDFILSLPAMESLRSDYTEVWCAGQNVAIARFADCARSIVAVGLDRLGLLNAGDVVEKLRGFDSIVSWYGANRPEFGELTRELGLPIRFLPALPDGLAVQEDKLHAVDFYYNPAGTKFSSRLMLSDSWRICAIHETLCARGHFYFARVGTFLPLP